ncbi:MAG: hypothetical protein HY859_04315 [Caulobacterales bacterium]|nr:hypothetical protein [Caulobacterales bacterium]
MTFAAQVRARPKCAWLAAGLILLAYAALGNWLVLPGYRRFLAHGPSSAGDSGPDLALVWGASRTILWMLSFHLGAFCMAWAALQATGDRARTFRRGFAIGALVWIGLWTIPVLPGPYAAMFAGLGVVILLMIATVFGRAALTGEAFGDASRGPWRIASAFFFALATWDMCGLGSVGGILHPDAAARVTSQSLVVAQTSKLIVELAMAWALLALAALPARPARPGWAGR